MGRALAEAYPVAREAFEEADRAFAAAAADAGGSATASAATQTRPLTDVIFNGPDDRLGLTEITQPAILAVSVAACRVLTERGIQPAFVAGHSLGEYSANVAAGTFTLADAVRTVRRRGRYMQEAVPVGTGAMAAILGLDAAVVSQACADAAQGDIVAPANMNGAGQVVIAGAKAAVERAGARAKELGAKRVIPLAVSAPFHCALMKPA